MKQKLTTLTLLLLGLAVIAAAVFSLTNARELGVLAADDAFYFYLTAQHIVTGHGSTFDGINFTNGYHPLWMTVLLPIYWIAGSDLEKALRLVYALLSVMLVGSMVIYWRFLKKKCGSFAATTVLALFVTPIVLNQFLNGLESGLLILLLGVLLWAADGWDLLLPKIGIARKAALGLLLALVFLCRLDAAFIVIGIAVVTCLFYRVRLWRWSCLVDGLKAYWPVFVVFSLIVAPYLIWNHTQTGKLVPVSGALKSSFPYIEGSIRRALNPQWAPYSVIIIAFVVFASVSTIARDGLLRRQCRLGPEADSGTVMLTGIGLGGLLHFIYSVCFTTWGTFSWHFASYVPLFLFLGASTFAWLRLRGLRWVSVALCAAIIALGMMGTVWLWGAKKQMHDMWFTAATWAKHNTSEDATFGMTDCGYFAYFSHRRTVNLDGLINGYEFQRALTSDDLPRYFERCGLDYVCDYEVVVNGREQHTVSLTRILPKEYRQGKRGYEMRLEKSRAFYASPQYKQYTGKPIQFMIWKYRPEELYQLPDLSAGPPYAREFH